MRKLALFKSVGENINYFTIAATTGLIFVLRFMKHEGLDDSM